MEMDKNQMEDTRELKAEEAAQMNHIGKPDEGVPTMNTDNDPPANWHLESGEKINEYDNY